ncbi:MAG TPA: glutathione S-transferase [Burkholderiaceae bacterium]|jgi:glutathione S-transferase
MSIAQPAKPIRLYRHPLSGHAHRVELFLSLLGLPVELVNVDLKNAEHRQPEFLVKNPFGQVPVIEDGAVTLSDSTAILVYLAIQYGEPSWLPRDAAGAATVQRYLSLAAGEIAYGPALARKINVFGLSLDRAGAEATAVQLLSVLNEQLSAQQFLAGKSITIADIAAYSYIAHAPEGGISLDPYAHIQSWLKRIEAMPGFIPMQPSKVGLVR